MYKHLFFVLFLSLLSLCLLAPGTARADDKMRVAVVEFDVKGDVSLKEAGSIVAEWMITSIAKTGRFDLQERVLLKRILEEQKLSLGGLVEEKESTAKIGELFGVEAIITGSVIKWGDTVSVTARLINTSSGTIIRTAEIRTGSMERIPEKIDDLARVLAGEETVDATMRPASPASQQPPEPVRNGKRQYWKDPASGMTFTWIDGGCYLMGQSEEERQEVLDEAGEKIYEKKYADEVPRHRVCVDGFWMGLYEVTNGQFRQFTPEHDSRDYKGYSLNGDRQPAVNVSWEQAVAYADWLGKQNGNGESFRLPSEAEWEFACRAGSEGARFWGDESDEACEYANVYDRTAHDRLHYRWHHHDCDDQYVVTAPVGSFYPNDYMLYDMLGNAWEWTADTYDRNAYATHAEHNPLHNNPEDENRSRRGGSWNSAPGSIRCANRGNRSEDRKNKKIGFRLIRVPGQNEQ